MMRECDMGRIGDAPLHASMLIKAMLPRGRIIVLRQRNFSLYADRFANVRGGDRAPRSSAASRPAGPASKSRRIEVVDVRTGGD